MHFPGFKEENRNYTVATMFSFRLARPFPFHCGVAAFLFAGCLFSGCEKVTPYLEKVKKALDRETVEEVAARAPLADKDIPPPPPPVKMEPLVNKEARVSVLGYHDFTDGTSTNDMILNVNDFRDQMQAIKDAQLPVISLSLIHISEPTRPY